MPSSRPVRLHVLLRAIAVGAVGLAIGLAAYRPAMRRLYPIHYGGAISRSARSVDIDPFLIASVVRVESGFDARATSRRGARGLMQILPSTGRWIAAQADIVGFEEEQLYDPAMSIRMGTWYMAELRREFGALTPALAAFNAGRGNVRSWMERGRWDGTLSGLDDLPFPETRVYVRRVLSARNWYHRVYGRWPDAGGE